VNSRILAARIVHDVSLSSWFGGELMGAVGLNGAAAQLSDPRQRSRAANAGWSRFSPLLLSSVAAHLASGVVLVREDKGRLTSQQGFARGSAIKTGLTGAALAGTVYQQVLGQRMARGGDQPVVGATQPGPGTAPEQASAQRQLNVLQFLIPALTGSAWIVHSANGELARPAQQAKGTLSRVGTLAAGQGRTPLLAAAAVAAGSGLLALSRRRSAAAPVSTAAPVGAAAAVTVGAAGDVSPTSVAPLFGAAPVSTGIADVTVIGPGGFLGRRTETVVPPLPGAVTKDPFQQ
jgi:hypothetical protein